MHMGVWHKSLLPFRLKAVQKRLHTSLLTGDKHKYAASVNVHITNFIHHACIVCWRTFIFFEFSSVSVTDNLTFYRSHLKEFHPQENRSIEERKAICRITFNTFPYITYSSSLKQLQLSGREMKSNKLCDDLCTTTCLEKTRKKVVT